MLYVPEYYFHFSCLKGACRHTCCAGWEIDIDEESLARFRAMPGALGEKLRANIDEDEEGAHFRLTADERCPMLNDDGLCELLLHNGGDTDVLCDVCDNHPEFHNFSFAGREEYGLGLCCEAAAKLILGWEQPVKLVPCGEEAEADDPEDMELLALREELFSLAQDRTKPIEARMDTIAKRLQADCQALDVGKWIPMLLELERLDEAWAEALRGYAAADAVQMPALLPEYDAPLEQLLVYLLYRHLPQALEDGMLRHRVLFCVLMTKLVYGLCQSQPACSGELNFGFLTEIVRMFSSEIEYSDENIDAIIDRLAELEQ